MRSAEIMLDPHPSSVGRARRWLSRQLEEWELEDFDYDVSVVLSELVTNAVLHARTQIELSVTEADDVVRVEVFDHSEVMPAPRSHASSSSTGRGLHLVAALASSWGWEPRQRGKVVWAEFAEAPHTRSTLGGGSSAEGRISVLGEHGRPGTSGPAAGGSMLRAGQPALRVVRMVGHRESIGRSA